MKIEYDLSTMKSRKNPYASKLKKSVTMRLSEDVPPKAAKSKLAGTSSSALKLCESRVR
jgi:hypothetical protein